MNAKRSAAVAIGSAIVLAVAGCGGSSDAASSTSNYRLASYLGSNLAMVQAIGAWADDFESSGGVAISRHFDGSLYGAEQVRDALKNGTLDFGHFATAYHPDDFPVTDGLLSVPFVTSNAPAVAETIRELYRTTDAVKAEFEKQGLHLLALTPTPPAVIGVKGAAPGSPEDLQGKQIRAVGAMIPPLTAVGAEPVGMPAPDTYEALQTGVLDGFTSLPMDIAAGSAMQEVTDAWVDPGVGIYAAVFLTASLKTWNEMSDEEKGAAEEAAAKITERLVAELEKSESAACSAVKEKGVEISAFSPDDVTQWKDAVGSAPFDAWTERVTNAGSDPEAIWDAYTSTLAKWEDTHSDYQPGMVACAQAQ